MIPTDPLDGHVRAALAAVISRAPLAPDFAAFDVPAPRERRRRGVLVGATALMAAVVAVIGFELLGDTSVETTGHPAGGEAGDRTAVPPPDGTAQTGEESAVLVRNGMSRSGAAGHLSKLLGTCGFSVLVPENALALADITRISSKPSSAGNALEIARMIGVPAHLVAIEPSAPQEPDIVVTLGSDHDSRAVDTTKCPNQAAIEADGAGSSEPEDRDEAETDLVNAWTARLQARAERCGEASGEGTPPPTTTTNLSASNMVLVGGGPNCEVGVADAKLMSGTASDGLVPIFSADGGDHVIAYWSTGIGWLTLADVNDPTFDLETTRAAVAEAMR